MNQIVPDNLKPIPGDGLDGYYASADGRIFSTRGRKLRELTQYPVKAYLGVKAGGRTWYVHQLVCAAFHGPCPLGMETCHRNGRHHDNRPENLYWGTHKQNIADAVRHGTQHRFKPEDCVRARKLTPDQVIEIRKRIGAGERYRLIARDYDVDPAVLTYIKQGRTYRGVTGAAGADQYQTVAA